MFILIDYIRIFILIVITMIYAIFDVFNQRNVPDSFAYFSVAIALVALLISGENLVYTAILTVAITSISYFLYRIGELGAGDGFEFVAIVLLLPIQPQAIYLPNVNQLALPFILSVFVAAAIVTIIAVPLYYLLLVKKDKDIKAKKRAGGGVKAATILFAYLILLALLVYFTSFRWIDLLIVLLVAIPSAITTLYETEINVRMVEKVYPKELDVGDMIAVNLMSKEDIRYFENKSKLFERLVTKQLRAQIKDAKRKLPVYKKAVPLALFTFIGVLIAILFGNILLVLI